MSMSVSGFRLPNQFHPSVASNRAALGNSGATSATANSGAASAPKTQAAPTPSSGPAKISSNVAALLSQLSLGASTGSGGIGSGGATPAPPLPPPTVDANGVATPATSPGDGLTQQAQLNLQSILNNLASNP